MIFGREPSRAEATNGIRDQGAALRALWGQVSRIREPFGDAAPIIAVRRREARESPNGDEVAR